MFIICSKPNLENNLLLYKKLCLLEDSARQNNIQVVSIPFPFNDPEQYFNDFLFEKIKEKVALYFGPIPQSFDHYKNLEKVLLKYGIRLVNSFNDSKQISQIEEWYPLIKEFTAETFFIKNENDVKKVSNFPLFIKGNIKSLKEQGLNTCVVNNMDELLLHVKNNSFVAARKILPLKYSGENINGFPVAREYRFLLAKNKVFAHRFYWKDKDCFGNLDSDNLTSLIDLAEKISFCFEADLLVVDFAQLENNNWKVIEVGDVGHTALEFFPHHFILNKLKEIFN